MKNHWNKIIGFVSFITILTAFAATSHAYSNYVAINPIVINFPTVSGLTFNHNPYDPNIDGDLELTYTVSGITQLNYHKAYITIYDKNDASNVITTDSFALPSMYNGTYARDLIVSPSFLDGAYTLEIFIRDFDDDKDSAKKTIDFEVDGKPPVIKKLTPDSSTYDPANDNNGFNFSFDLEHVRETTPASTADLKVKLYDPQNMAVETLPSLTLEGGHHIFTWDGKINNKAPAPGNYLLTIDGSVDYGWDGQEYIIDPVSAAFTVAGEDSDPVTPSPTPNPSPSPLPASQECASFSDVDKDDASCDAIKYVKSIGAMTGNPDGTFNPNGILQRDQVAKIVEEAFDLYDKQTDYCLSSNPFPDITVAEWSYQYICRGKSLGMINGYTSGADAGYYRPARSVNRVEFLALALRNLDENMPSLNSTSYTDVEKGLWYSGYAKYAKDNGLFSGSKLNATNLMARSEVAEVLYKLHNLGKI